MVPAWTFSAPTDSSSNDPPPADGRRQQGEREERQPQRAGAIAHHAHREVQFGDPGEAAATRQAGARLPQHAAVLEVPLAPPLVPLRPVQQGRRALLVAPAEVFGQTHAPPGPPHQGGLDEVVAQNLPAQRGGAGEHRQVAAGPERLDPQNRVVAPVVPVRPGPQAEAPQEDRGVQPGGELLPPGQHAGAADRRRRGLQNAAGLVRGDAAGHLDQRRPGHQAIGVEGDHELVVPAPAFHEVRHVPSFAGGVLRAVPVEDAFALRQGVGQVRPGAFLGEPHVGVRAVGQQEEVEPPGGPALLRADGPQAVQHRPHPGAHAGRVFIINRHQHGGRREVGGVEVRGRLRDRRRRGPPQIGGEPQRRRPERQRDPAEQHGEQPDQRPAEPRGGVRQRAGEGPRGRRGGRGGQQRQRDADRGAGGGAEGGRGRGGAGRPGGVRRHIEQGGGAATWRRNRRPSWPPGEKGETRVRGRSLAGVGERRDATATCDDCKATAKYVPGRLRSRTAAGS